MTMPSDPAPQAHRLHPLSWLFVLVQQLKSFALPLLVLLFTGRGNTYELWGLVGVAVLALYSALQYVTYRYHFDGEGLVIRSGLLQRSWRHVPYARIHNVGLHQSVLHRVFGVAEVRLESAGGKAAEGTMRVLALADAQALERRLRNHGAEADAVAHSEEVAPPLLALDTGEVVRLGLSSNRGMVVVAALFGSLYSISDDAFWQILRLFGVERLMQHLPGWSEIADYGVLAVVLSAGLLFLAVAVALRVLSVLLALVQYHGFRLDRHGDRLTAQRGLLARMRHSLPVHRIQSWSLQESLVHRWLGRQSLRVDNIAATDQQGEGSLRQLAPVATPDKIAEVLGELRPRLPWPLPAWRSLHPNAWRRQFAMPAALAGVACAALAWRFGVPALWLLAAWPLLWLRARIWAAHAGYTEVAGVIAVREGWLDRHWRFAELSKLQALQLSQSPFDRRHGMASLHLDTAGASPFEPPLRIRYLPEPEARALYDRLARHMAE